MVGGHAEQELGDDVRAAAHREVRLGGHPGGLHGDVAGGVADAEHQHPLALEHVRGPVVVRVQLLAGERLGARVRRLRPARVPVVAVRDHDVGVGPDLRLADVTVLVAHPQRHVEAARAPRLDLDDLGAERDPVAEPEVVDVRVEVRRDLPVRGVVRQVVGHREGAVLHQVPRGVDVQRAVGRGHPVVVAVAPVAADLAAGLEAVERDPACVQHLRRCDAGRACSDHAHALVHAVPSVRPAASPARREGPTLPELVALWDLSTS